jgi:hypothetical protein
LNQNDRAQAIISELIAVPTELWDQDEHGGQTIFTVVGHSGHALYFAKWLMNPASKHPLSRDAQAVYRMRLGQIRLL